MANPEMQNAYIEHGGQKPARPKGKKQPGSSLAYKSQNQAVLDAKWAGIKEGFIFMMNRYEETGAHCWSCGAPGNSRTLDLHHLRRRSQGGSYDARNAELLCRSCHERETGTPQFSGGGAWDGEPPPEGAA